MRDRESEEHIGQMIREWLQSGREVAIDGLGTFVPTGDGSFEFIASTKPKVFIAYVEEDAPHALRLFQALEAAGFHPWMDKRRLLPGQNWPRSIERAIQTSDFFIPCFSGRAARKRGTFQAELRYAFDCAERLPLDDIYMIPVRLENCLVPARVAREIQYVDLFPDWSRGVQHVIRTINGQWIRRSLPLAV